MSTAFVFSYSDISGGTATLSIRIAEWLLDRGYSVLYICQKYNDMSNVKAMNELGVKVHKWKLTNLSKELKVNYNFEKYIFLSYTLDGFISVELLKSEINIVNNILYVVSYLGLIKAYDSNLILKLIIRIFYGKIIGKLINNGNIIYMDYIQLENDQNFYCFDLKDKNEIVYLLPMTIKPYNDVLICKKMETESFNILTIARADFPFKGYMVGLVDDFLLLCKKYEQITLTIITFGENELDILNKVELLPKSIKEKIRIIGQTPYKDLPKFFSITHLYIGMGTTLLDAVNEGTPAIAVLPNTYANISSGFFHAQPDRLAADKKKSIPAIECIKKVIEMDKKEYKKLCRVEYEALNNNYNIDRFCEFLVDEKKYDNSMRLFNYEIVIHTIMKKINMMLKAFT